MTIDIDILVGYIPPSQLSSSSFLCPLPEEGIQESDIQNVENTNEEEIKENEELSEDADNDVVTSKDIQFVLDTISKQALMISTDNADLLWNMHSQTSKKIHHNINSKKSGEGKYYLLKLVTNHSPESFI